jgi:hypothetical protein
VLLYQRGHNFTVGSYSLYGSSLIFRHEAAIPCHIRTKDSGELTLKFFRGHIGSPPQIQKPPKGYRNPSEASFTPPSGKFFHDSLQKVRVVLLVISVPDLFAVQRIADFGGDVYILYMAEMAKDSR